MTASIFILDDLEHRRAGKLTVGRGICDPLWYVFERLPGEVGRNVVGGPYEERHQAEACARALREHGVRL